MMFQALFKEKKKNQCLFNYIIEKVITIVNGLDPKKKSDNVKIKNNDFQEKNLQSQILK